jgi:micrococcal nuclease
MDRLVEAKITKHLDGDTIKVTLTNGFIITVRLLLIDCPEYKRAKIDQQLYGYEALQFAKDNLKVGDIVFLEFEGDVIKDKYDRHLAYLWYLNSEGRYVLYNEEVVRQGLSKVAYIFSQNKYLNRILLAQDEARFKNLNIWSIKGYVVNYSFNMEAIGDNSTRVYISRNNNSKLFHKFKDIHNLKNTKSITLFEAKKLRYTHCKKCFSKGI